MGRFGRFLAVTGLACLLATGAWLVGFLTALSIVAPAVAVPDDVVAPDNFRVFSEVWEIVGDEFRGEQPVPDEVTFASVRGLVEGLGDPYAEFRSQAELDDFVRQAPPDVVSGIGVWVEPASDGALIVATVPDSPARRAGLAPGVLVIAVDDSPTAGLSRPELLNALTGPPGTAVVLRVVADDELPSNIEVVRAEFQLPLVEVRQLNDGIGYLRISHFAPGLEPELDSALEGLMANDRHDLVLDLRDNPGGDLEVLRAVASRFVTGPLWIEHRRSGDETVVSVPGQSAVRFDSIAVVVNEGTASAAEILAGLLREAVAAPLVGGRTFGKPAIQGVIRLTDGSMLRISMGNWTTPGGISVSDGGLMPDRSVAAEAEQLSAAADAVLRAPSGG